MLLAVGLLMRKDVRQEKEPGGATFPFPLCHPSGGPWLTPSTCVYPELPRAVGPLTSMLKGITNAVCEEQQRTGLCASPYPLQCPIQLHLQNTVQRQNLLRIPRQGQQNIKSSVGSFK